MSGKFCMTKSMMFLAPHRVRPPIGSPPIDEITIAGVRGANVDTVPRELLRRMHRFSHQEETLWANTRCSRCSKSRGIHIGGCTSAPLPETNQRHFQTVHNMSEMVWKSR